MKKILLNLLFGLLLFVPVQAEENFIYDDHGKRDPFWSLVSPTGAIMNYDSDLQITDLILEGIISGPEGNNLAIINSNIVKVHDRIGFFVVEKIDEDKVILVKGQENFMLKIKKEE